jgi:hypothetical protein
MGLELAALLGQQLLELLRIYEYGVFHTSVEVNRSVESVEPPAPPQNRPPLKLEKRTWPPLLSRRPRYEPRASIAFASGK